MDKHKGQGLRVLEINPSIYSQLLFNKEAKIIQWQKEQSLINGAGNTQKNKIKTLPHTIYKKINSKWTKDPNVKLKL